MGFKYFFCFCGTDAFVSVDQPDLNDLSVDTEKIYN